jgi:hypothetical protein
MVKVVVQDVEYETDGLSDNTKAQLASLQFLEQHIQQIQNEIAVYQTARQAYAASLKKELKKVDTEATS